MPEKPLRSPTEPSALDDGVDLSEEWAFSTGAFKRDMSTDSVESLSKGLSLAEGVVARDPYNQAPAKPQDSSASTKRRSLDDMRQLSDEIKAAGRDRTRK